MPRAVFSYALTMGHGRHVPNFERGSARIPEILLDWDASLQKSVAVGRSRVTSNDGILPSAAIACVPHQHAVAGHSSPDFKRHI